MQIMKVILKPSQLYISNLPWDSFMKSPSTASQEFQRYILQNYHYLLHIDPNLLREQVHAMPAAFRFHFDT